MPEKAHSFKVRFPLLLLLPGELRARGRLWGETDCGNDRIGKEGAFSVRDSKGKQSGRKGRRGEKNAPSGGFLQRLGGPLLRDAVEGARMEFRGNREVVLEDCRGILEYDTDVVRVRAGKLIIRFTGRGLTIKCMTADSMVVEGFITGIEFMV